MPRRYPPGSAARFDLVACGRKVAAEVPAPRLSDQTIYVWCRRHLIDTGQSSGTSSSDLSELGAARKRVELPVTEEARPRSWRLPPSGGPRVRPEGPGGAAFVFARRSDGRRALRSRSCVPSVELTVVHRRCFRLCRLL